MAYRYLQVVFEHGEDRVEWLALFTTTPYDGGKEAGLPANYFAQSGLATETTIEQFEALLTALKVDHTRGIDEARKPILRLRNGTAARFSGKTEYQSILDGNSVCSEHAYLISLRSKRMMA